MKKHRKQTKIIIDYVKNFKYISFDIFDTLVNRNIDVPFGVFQLMESFLTSVDAERYTNFAKNRLEAEKQIRKIKGKKEISLKDIYNRYNHLFECKKEEIKFLINLEIQTEIQISVPNMEIREVYDYCLENNKKVVICSDMYLDLVTIKKILEKCNIKKYECIFLSSDMDCTKKTGKLFEVLIEILNIKKEDLFHIGDNYRSDYLSPQKKGIKAYWYIKKNSFYKGKIESRCIEATLKNLKYGASYWEKVGYEVMGPFLFGFSKWLMSEFQSKEYENIYFLSRDGYIIKEAMQLVCNQEIYNKINYLYVSRRSLIIPTIWLYKNYGDICNGMFWKRRFTLREYIENLGLEFSTCKETLLEQGYFEKDIFFANEVSTNGDLINIFSLLEKRIRENSYKEYINVIKYLRTNNFMGKVAIVDSGWYGNIQHALLKLCQADNIQIDIQGYYIGIRDNSLYWKTQKMKGYLFDGEKNNILQQKEEKINAIVEAFFSHTEGSVYKYEENDGYIKPLLYEKMGNNTKDKILTTLQKSSLICMNRLYMVKILNPDKISIEHLFKGFYKIGLNPTVKDASKIYLFVDNEIKSTIYYLFHLNELKSDMINAKWKIGILKRVFLVKINYFRLMVIIDLMLKGRE